MSAATSPLARLLHRLRYALYGHRAGLGRPVPPRALDNEYISGAWDHFFGPGELARHELLVRLIHQARPRPRLLDLGCGSGRLASLLQPAQLTAYLGVDLSIAGLDRARALNLPHGNFACHDFEEWTPAPASFDVITFNECLGYAADPLATALRFADTMPADGTLLVSHFRATNHAAFWQRLGRRFDFPLQDVVTNPAGQSWDLRRLVLRS